MKNAHDIPMLMTVLHITSWCITFRFWTAFRTKGRLREKGKKILMDYLKKVVKDPELQKKLTPDYDVGCKRITPSNTYLQSFNRENVSLVTSKIKCFTEEGIQTEDGKIHEVDAIIYATGYSVLKSYNAFEVLGKSTKDKTSTEDTQNGHISLKEDWGDQPNAYKGITYPGFPNFYFLLGPGTVLGHNTVVYMIECEVSYVVDAIKAMVDMDIKSLEVKKEVNDKYQVWSYEWMKNKVFQTPSCTSWYRNTAGINWTLWPGDLTRYWWVTRKIDLNEYTCVW